jgi:hypothetical protein
VCWRFVLGDSEAHTLSHSAVSDPLLSRRVQNLVRKKARHLDATSIKSILPSSIRCCKIDRGILKIPPRHIYQEIAVKRCRSCSFGAGKIYAVCRTLESKTACTYWIRLVPSPTRRKSCCLRLHTTNTGVACQKVQFLVGSLPTNRPTDRLRAETCAKRKSTSLCLLAIPAFYRIAGLSNRRLNSNWGICLR